jgi:Ca2+-binding RTX toxin-like protein
MAHINGTPDRDFLYGTAFEDELYGLGGNDVLRGRAGNDRIDGGEGIDVLIGRTGDDIYYIDTLRDRVIERAGEGLDTVISTVSARLRAEVEDLTLVGGARMGIGNELSNLIIADQDDDLAIRNILDGGGADDVLRGGGGNDSLYGGATHQGNYLDGGAGADGFYFTEFASPVYDGYDRLMDFSSADTIFLYRPTFDQLDAGVLAADAFVIGSAAQDAEDRIIFNPGQREIFYDPDGTGPEEAVRIAGGIPWNVTMDRTDFIAYG